uniref:L1 transposable element RRM domain-containing protein n=1 Tax=Knipowitschia caucasica TaxID=637954 RepID=A0AAV2KJ35_KNICA
MGEAELRISQMEDKMGGLETDSNIAGKKVSALWDRVQALENHSKRNNVRLVGLKETYGTDGTLEMCVKKVLSEGLGIVPEAEFEIERLHRVSAPVPNEGQPPHAVLIRFLRQSAREKVLRAAAVKRGVTWEGNRLSIFPDVTKELAEKRKTFLAAKKALQQHNVRYTLAFPATLRFTWRGKNQRFTQAEEAERLINRHSNN